MADRRCSQPDCERRHYGRGFCKWHYDRALRAQAIEETGQPSLRLTHHRLTNVDREAATADCSICGPNVHVWLRQDRGYFQCPGASNLRNPHYQRRYKYGLTRQGYEALLAVQGGTCAICYRPPRPGRSLDVDHDHRCCPGGKSCGKCVRGLLCRKCNSAIGYFRDDATLALRASMYLVQK